MENTDFQSINESPKRPNFLMVLAVLSFVSIGFSLLSGVITLSAGPLSDEDIIQQRVELTELSEEMRSNDLESMAVTIEKIQRMLVSLNDHFYANQLLAVLFLAVGFVGVLFMWRGRRLGFHLYIIYSICAAIQLYFFVSPADIPSFLVIWNVLISAVFVLMYARNLHWMKQ